MNIDINNTIHTNFCTFSFLFLVINNIYSIYHINNNIILFTNTQLPLYNLFVPIAIRYHLLFVLYC